MPIRQLSLAALVLICGCAAPGPGPLAPPAGDRIAAECALLAAAQAETAARGLQVWPDVMAGCPGAEGPGAGMPLAAQSAALRRANAAPLPPEVRAAGQRGEVVYRRMITRGVPEAVAQALVRGPAFRAAVR